MMNRYERQMALPEIDEQKQEKLMNSTVLMVGAGGLGSAALPYLAGAGIGRLVIADHDRVNITNLHRQTIYRADQAGKSKVDCTSEYLRDLNPDIRVTRIAEKIEEKNIKTFLSDRKIDLILDGSDNYETKALLNDLSIRLKVPLITAAVNQFNGQVGIFEGYKDDHACYRCLFPEFIEEDYNRNENGILGTCSGMIGIIQAHTALLRMLEIDNYLSDSTKQNFINIDLKTLDISRYSTNKDPQCAYCNTGKA